MKSFTADGIREEVAETAIDGILVEGMFVGIFEGNEVVITGIGVGFFDSAVVGATVGNREPMGEVVWLIEGEVLNISRIIEGVLVGIAEGNVVAIIDGVFEIGISVGLNEVVFIVGIPLGYGAKMPVDFDMDFILVESEFILYTAVTVIGNSFGPVVL